MSTTATVELNTSAPLPLGGCVIKLLNNSCYTRSGNILPLYLTCQLVPIVPLSTDVPRKFAHQSHPTISVATKARSCLICTGLPDLITAPFKFYFCLYMLLLHPQPVPVALLSPGVLQCWSVLLLLLQRLRLLLDPRLIQTSLQKHLGSRCLVSGPMTFWVHQPHRNDSMEVPNLKWIYHS